MAGRFWRAVAVIGLLIFGMGCATIRDSVMLGMGSGIASGAAAGGLMARSHSGQNAIIGGAIGAVIGGGIAYFTHKEVERRESVVRKETLFNLEKFGVSEAPLQGSSIPSISFRVIEEQRVETHRQGNKVIEGHRIWILSDDSNLLYNDKSKEEDEAAKTKK